MSPLLSVILPSYNVASKIQVCFDSLDLLYKRLPQVECIFVDDVSTDNTFELISEFISTRHWARAYQLKVNSGSPSTPRNVGLQKAKGKYVFYLDPDDQILPDGIIASLSIAEKTQADIVRAPLIRFDGKTETVVNKISDWGKLQSLADKRLSIVKNHSTTVCGLYKRNFIFKQELQWPTDLRIAEDAIFLYSALKNGHVEYSDEPDFIYHVALLGDSLSSTQQYQERELDHQLRAWERASAILAESNIDYFKERGQVALQAVFQSMIRFNKGGFSEEQFSRFSKFLNKNGAAVQKFTYGARFAELRNLALKNDYLNFMNAIKIRLLVNGFDLKFIESAIPYLKEYYQIKIDQWTGHEAHSEENSKMLLEWADAIHCEWMLGNAVWYSRNKKPRQSLVIRLHRFELTRNYGHLINLDNVDKIITIAPKILEEVQETFGYPREKLCYIPNYLEVDSYAQSGNPEKVYNIAMVGILPKLKGYRRALEILRDLRLFDQRYNLTVYGKKPEELSWVINNPEEKAYYDDCDQFIRTNGLESSVQFSGWVDTREALANHGFILSMSDLEGSHVAAAEGFASGNITILRPWEGSQYMYPSQYIMSNLNDMTNYILECRDYSLYKERGREGQQYVSENYSIDKFLELYTKTVPTPYSVP